jgi:flagellar basal-body rod protein FlgC
MMLVGAGGTDASTATASVRVTKVVDDPAPPVMRYEPGHPDANSEGYVAYPDINPVQEMADMMDAVRAYQLNAAAVNASKQIVTGAIDILK